MAIKGNSTFTTEPSVNSASQNENESEPPDDVTEVQESSVKRKVEKSKLALRQKMAARCPGKYHSRLAEFFYRNVGTEFGTGQRKILTFGGSNISKRSVSVSLGFPNTQKLMTARGTSF